MEGQYPDKRTHGHAAVAVVVVPLPAQGHLNQLLQLSRLIARYGIRVHYVGSSSHNRQAKARAHAWDPQTSAMIRFHDFLLDPLDPPKPDPATSSFPSHLQPVFEAASQLREPVSRLLRGLASEMKRVVVVHDSLMGSVIQDVGSISNAESYTFHTVSAFALFFYIWELSGKPADLQLPPSDALLATHIPPNQGCFTRDFADFMAKQYTFLSLSSGRLYNTSRSIEDKYLRLLQKLPLNANKKLYAVGPLNPVGRTRKQHTCLDWLDRHPPDSVLYVSFGTTISLSEGQIRELATGLERSEQRFMWVVRGADAAARREEVPGGFEERVGERGLVVREWAPQMDILGHPATGGFLSHCGWNSCMESISMGVPMAAWPMHSDQPKNGVLVTRVLSVGLALLEDWDGLVTASAVESAVRRLMASEEGGQMRQRAAELAAEVQASVAAGGVSSLEMDSFIAHITR